MANLGYYLSKKISKSTKTLNNIRSFSSALFIPGNKATENFSYLTPYFDFDERFADVEVLKKNIKSRKLNYNIDEMKKSWDFFKNIDNNRKSIEEKRENIAYKMKKHGKNKDQSVEEKKILEGLFLQGKLLKQDLKSIKESLWELEETIIPKLLKLPNEIDEKTPENDEIILKTVGEILINNKINKNHLEIGKKLGLIEYTNPLHFYLQNEAAYFEIGALSWANKILHDSGMLKIAGADFAKSLVVEAAGLNHEDPYESFHIENSLESEKDYSRLHLIGGASLIAFLAMHTKQLINPKNFPLRYFSSGRQYVPVVPRPSAIGLFGACQASAVHSHIMVQEKSSTEHQEEFEKLVKTVTELYDQLEIPYRIVLRSADQLKTWESLRVSFELWSNYYGNFIETGHISICGNFFSKRLLIAYQTPNGRDYPAIISGTVLSVPRLLACLLEQNENEFFIPQCIKNKMPI